MLGVRRPTEDWAQRRAKAHAVAVVGAGAAAQAYHFPALAAHPGTWERTVVVEQRPERRAAIESEFGLRAVASLDEVIDDIDAAVIATPHGSHHSIALACVRRGVDVLCEKPLAETAAQGLEIAQEGERHQAIVAVNHTRRVVPSYRRIASLLADGTIGAPRRIEIEWGEVFGWPVTTSAHLGTASGSRGVLLDIGAHALDLVCWWIGDRPRVVSYRDDSLGGSEAVAAVEFERDGCTGSVWLSWLSTRENSIRIEGEHGRIDCGLYEWDTLTVTDRSGRARRLRTEPAPRQYEALVAAVVDDFLSAVSERRAPLVSARDALPSLQLIDECYSRRAAFDMPWFDAFRRLELGP